MATASPRAESCQNHRGTSQLHAVGESRSGWTGGLIASIDAFCAAMLPSHKETPVSSALLFGGGPEPGRPVSRFSRAPASASFSLMQVFTAAPQNRAVVPVGATLSHGAAPARNAHVTPGGGPRLRPRLHNVRRPRPFQGFLYRCCCCPFSRVFAPVIELIAFVFSTRRQFPVPKSKGRKACLGRPFTWR